jgi:hypothetical protein
MAKKEWEIFNGALVIVIGDKFEVYEKDLPSEIDTNVNWLGNFGISEKETGKKHAGKVSKYEIQTPDKENKKLYFWSEGKSNEIPNQTTKIKNKKKYRTGELDLGDPPVGWEK